MLQKHKLTPELIKDAYPEAKNLTIRQLNFIVKYQLKFELTLENIKCLNQDCKNLKSKGTTKSGLKYCCSTECYNIMRPEIIRLRKIKYKQTSLDRFGVENPIQSLVVKEKMVQNSIKKYGTSSPNSVPEIKRKQQEACLQIYGYTTSMQHPAIKEKMIKNNIEKYGTKSPNSNSEIKRKQQESSLIKYGVSKPLQNKDIKEKMIKNNIEKYGVSNPKRKHYTNAKYWNDIEFWKRNFITNDNYFDYITCMDYFNCEQPATHTQIKKLGIKYTKTAATSLQEQAIIPYLESLGVPAVANERTIIPNQELDIWIPSLKLAIEWNGSYWHSYHETIGISSQQLDYDFCKYRHQRKALACLEAGIRLLQLYEDINLSNWKEQIDKFIAYDPDTVIDIYDLDSGCYPLGVDYKILEPESRMVHKTRALWNAGKIKIKENSNGKKSKCSKICIM